MSDELEHPDDVADGSEAGWYPDPDDPSRIRWWDGAVWTGFRREWNEVDGAGVDLADDATPDEASPDDAIPDDAIPDDATPTTTNDDDPDVRGEPLGGITPTAEPEDGARRRHRTRVASAAAVAVAIGLTAWVATRPTDDAPKEPSSSAGAADSVPEPPTIEQVPSGPGTPAWTTIPAPVTTPPEGRRFRSGDGSLTMVVPESWRRVDPRGRVVAWSVVDDAGAEVGKLTVQVARSAERIRDLVPVANALAAAPDPDVNLLGASFDHVMYPAPGAGDGDGEATVARLDYRTSSVLGTSASARLWTRLASTDAGSRQVIVRLITTPELFERAAIAAEPYGAAAIVRLP